MTNAQIIRGFARWYKAAKRSPKKFESIAKMTMGMNAGKRALTTLKEFAK